MTDKGFLKLILAHLGIGALIAWFPVLAKLYALLIVLVGLYFVIKNKNKNQEVLYCAAYIVGSEVFLRTTFGNPFHEYGKYFVCFFLLLGIFYSGIPKKANPYWLFLLLLVPSVIYAFTSFDNAVRIQITFDILGPVCLGICALYTYKRPIRQETLNRVLLSLGLPILACCAFLILHYPFIVSKIENTESNYFLSGFYAPNQMATTLGLGVFVFFARIHQVQNSNRILIAIAVVTAMIYYRGLMTFSRGGMITGLVMVAILLLFFYLNFRNSNPHRLKLVWFALLFPLVFIVASYQTNGLLFKRYANQNPSGLYKSNDSYGRQDMALEEIEFFKENPIIGMGVGEVKKQRKVIHAMSISSHNEVTRMLAEHGIFGLLSMLILIATPIFHYLSNRQNLYLLCFFAFWLLTINHSGMRTAAPSFIYALALLTLRFDDSANSV